MSKLTVPTQRKSGLVDARVALARKIVAGAGGLAAASCAWLLLVASFDDAECYVQEGFASTAHWLAYACGLARRTATDHVRVARALAAHHHLAREMRGGRLSYSQARAIARVATPDEHQLVDDLIDVAQHGTVSHLETVVRGLRTVADEEVPTDRTDREYLKQHWNEQSTWQLSVRLDPERGSVISSAIDAITEHESISSTDALVRLAEIGLAVIAAAGDGDLPELRGHESAAVVIQLEAAMLSGGSAEPSAASERAPVVAGPRRPFARIVGGPGLPPTVVQRLICAGRIRTVVRDGQNVLDVGRAQRLVTHKQYLALMIRQDGQCARPGCTATKHLQAHHVIHWIHGGPTDLDNLVLLCLAHHLGHHDGAFNIRAEGRGQFTFYEPDGNVIAVVPLAAAPADDSGIPQRIDARPPHRVKATAATTRWDGQRLQHTYAISVLAHRRSLARAG